MSAVPEGLNEFVSEDQLQLLLHTLGLDRHDIPSRNFFAIENNSKYIHDLNRLESLGLMLHRADPFSKDSVVFSATEMGKHFSLSIIKKTRHAKFNKRYSEYLDSEGGYKDYAEFLGIEIPEREYQHLIWWNTNSPRLIRFKSSKAEGQFCKTVKEAKASYKAALAEQKRLLKCFDALVEDFQ